MLVSPSASGSAWPRGKPRGRPSAQGALLARAALDWLMSLAKHKCGNGKDMFRRLLPIVLCVLVVAAEASAAQNEHPELKLVQAPQSSPDQTDAASCLRGCIAEFNSCNETCLTLWKKDDAYSACRTPCLKEHDACRTECHKLD